MNTEKIISLFIRLALGASFLSAVADRFGFWGLPNTAGVAWGNWTNFVNYTSTLCFQAPASVVYLLAVLATGLEVILGVLLILGFQLRWVALASAFLLLAFALAMALNLGIKPPLDYSVFSASAGAFLLYHTASRR